MALWTLDGAIEKHDVEILKRHVDWSALSYSLQRKLTDTFSAPVEDDLPDFGSSFASEAATHVIERSLTPETLFALTDHMLLGHAAPDGLLQKAVLVVALKAHFTGLRHFVVEFHPDQQTTYRVYMTFEHWGWRVTQVDLPQNERQV
ncbi:hypothetical protein AA106555_0982 [Neokomagataea thailandica NBRC 106555]|nr:hypothetical protein AA106555_0982 [Neokomagataea thailandica NBRC 106555]